jgi:HEAT repeat protein
MTRVGYSRGMACTVFALCVLPAAAQPNVAAWDVLRRGLSDDNPDRRRQAVLSVGNIGPVPEVVETLNQALRDKDIGVRQTAAAEIGDAKIRQCIPNLKAALDDTGEVAFTAAKALWDMGDDSGRKILFEVITGELKDTTGFLEGAMRDAREKIRNPKKLAKMGLNEASGALLGPFAMGINLAQDMMKDSGAPTRALAITMLSRDCDPRGSQLMEWALTGDKNNLVRAAAAKALGRCGNLSSIPKLMLLLAEDSDAVRLMAASSIVRLSITTAPTTQDPDQKPPLGARPADPPPAAAKPAAPPAAREHSSPATP